MVRLAHEDRLANLTLKKGANTSRKRGPNRAARTCRRVGAVYLAARFPLQPQLVMKMLRAITVQGESAERPQADEARFFRGPSTGDHWGRGIFLERPRSYTSHGDGGERG